MTEQTNTQKALSIIKRLKKIRIASYVVLYLIFVAVCLSAYMDNNRIIMLFAFVSAIVSAEAVKIVTFRKMIIGPLYDQLDAPLFYELVQQGKLYTPSAVYQLQAEYYLGNYENVIAICNRKLSEKKTAKKYKYYYVTFLANCYFDIGDDEKLKEICDLFYQSAAKEKNSKKLTKRFAVFNFFNNYLNREPESCYKYIDERKTTVNMARTAINFKKARLALIKGETNEASVYFSDIKITAPNSNYGYLSEKALQGITEEREFKDNFDNLTENKDYVITPPTKMTKVFLKLRRVFGVLLIIIGVMMLITTVGGEISDYYEEKAYKAEYDVYCEKIHSIVEKDYDDVLVLDCFNLEKDGKVVDSMFLCKTSDSIIVGSTYLYPGDTEWYYNVVAEETYDYLTRNMLNSKHHIFESVTSAYTIHCAFYNNKADVPKDCYYRLPFTVKNTEFYYAITDVTELQPY